METEKIIENCIELGILYENGEFDDRGKPKYSVDDGYLEEYENKFGRDIYVRFAKVLLKKAQEE